MANIASLMFGWFLYFLLASVGPLGESSWASSLTKAANGACKPLVEIYGYKCEEHTVTTKDGYILSLQRIPYGRTGSREGGKKTPVLLQHGLLVDGCIWVLNPPDEALGFILADNGYDVWIVNSRGTVYSRGHTLLSANDSAYWDWSWDELVAYDLPATFEYVYKQSAHQKVHYVGHSLGTLMVLTAICQGKLLNMMRSAAMLAPIAYMKRVTSPVALAIVHSFLADTYYRLGVDEFDPRGDAAFKLLKILCKLPGIDCHDILTFTTGKNCCLNLSNSLLFLDHEPQSTSMKNAVHLSQMVRRGNIRKFDYGNNVENIKHYRQSSPPAYKISCIPSGFPLFLCYGGCDSLSDVEDVKHLLSILRQQDRYNLMVQYEEHYAHADFVIGVNASQDIYEPLVRFLELH